MLEHLRQFLDDLPVLSALLEHDLFNKPSKSNSDDMRFQLETLMRELTGTLKEQRQLYGVVHFPEQEVACPLCREGLKGYYWEINNPISGKGLCVSQRLRHALIAHEQLYLNEPMENISGVRLGESRLVFDLPGLASVMEGAAIPPEVIADLKEAIVIQKRQLVEAGDLAAPGGH